MLLLLAFLSLFIKNERQKIIIEITNNTKNNEIKLVYFSPNISNAIVGPIALATVFADDVKPTPSLSLEAGTYSFAIAVEQVRLIPKPNPWMILKTRNNVILPDAQ